MSRQFGSLKESLENRSTAYANQLREFAKTDLAAGVRKYLTEHSIDFGTAVKYRIGYVAYPVKGDERFAGAISIPYLTYSGPVALRFRRLSGEGDKIEQPHGQKNRPYNPDAFFAHSERIGICEGEMDAICATEILGVPSVGIPGAKGWKKEWRPLFADFTEVVIFADGDAPGREFANTVASDLGWKARIVDCPPGEDVSSMCAAGRVKELLPDDNDGG